MFLRPFGKTSGISVQFVTPRSFPLKYHHESIYFKKDMKETFSFLFINYKFKPQNAGLEF